ncbi:hypothetical protein [Streptomyces sp. PSKA30]|uniref:hypothetical protein n=1 Tax=Streptomyces sp. PSKA30 TaxID=2874597 RepID=UPI001CD112B4|nr:hypothetical protein [Streptomyces sp. PSKA30]MBZ9639522.1 hypothetical protein [Streptomyces sp. PSKA30]
MTRERGQIVQRLDITKKDAKACVRTPSTKRRGSFTMPDHVIEATSDYCDLGGSYFTQRDPERHP